MANSITDFTQASYDIANVVVTIDGKRPKLYTDGNVFQLSFAEDNITVTSDVYGSGIAVINHNGKADLTISISREDDTWKEDLIGNEDSFRTKAHEITINTPTETITTNSAYIGKVPDISAGKDAPNVDLAFHCINAEASKAQ